MSWGLVTVASVWLAATTTAAEVPPRTPDRQPGLQGAWSNATVTSLERPADLAGKAVFTAEEAAVYEKCVRHWVGKTLVVDSPKFHRPDTASGIGWACI